MQYKFGWISAAFVISLLTSGCADMSTGAIGPVPPALALPSATMVAAHSMPAQTEAVNGPSAFTSFCLRFADQCQSQPGAATSIALDDSSWHLLTKINNSVNREIWPEEDQKHYGRAEFWTIPTDGYGDCEDIALMKRKELLAAGLPMPSLRMAVVITPQHQRHAVLTIVTDKGDLVLDNLNDDVKSWDTTGYRWLERQGTVATNWVSIETAPRYLASNDADQPTAQTK